MSTQVSILRIALVGGGELCTEILQKTSSVFEQEGLHAPFIAVADPDPARPGMVLAERLGLLTFRDCHELYDPRYGIHLIILLTPDEEVLRDILQTRPEHIRILSYPVFRIFWRAIGNEERKLRQRTEEMETILNGIQDFILVISPDMTILEANGAFLQKMGCRRDQVVGRKCHEVYHALDHPCELANHNCPLQKVIRDQRHDRHVQRRRMPSGDMRYYEVSVYPVWEKNGKISRFIHISRDVTQQRQQDEEITQRLEQMVAERTRQLQETHEKLLHRDKMASLGKLSAAVVHEINNPIAGILNLIILMKRIIAEQALEPKDIDQFRFYLNLMETETRRTSRVVSNLLAFSRQSKLEMRPVNLNRLLDRTLMLNANLLKIAGVRVRRRLDPDLPDIVGSEDQLQQVFMNLISNAAQAMEAKAGGVLRIATGVSTGGAAVVVKVTDSGIGIAKEDMSKLFEPFFTTRKLKGVGLGLSVAYGIVQDHGGSIYVRSAVGEGATFRVKLPLHPSSPPVLPEGGRRELHENPDR
ncbi:MAG: ATP-binding protein [Desulfobacterales bacterium]|nr:ATP-binding protein [Desulfobacterales bacterium]